MGVGEATAAPAAPVVVNAAGGGDDARIAPPLMLGLQLELLVTVAEAAAAAGAGAGEQDAAAPTSPVMRARRWGKSRGGWRCRLGRSQAGTALSSPVASSSGCGRCAACCCPLLSPASRAVGGVVGGVS